MLTPELHGVGCGVKWGSGELCQSSMTFESRAIKSRDGCPSPPGVLHTRAQLRLDSMASLLDREREGASAGFCADAMYDSLSSTLYCTVKENKPFITSTISFDLEPCLSQQATRGWLSTLASTLVFISSPANACKQCSNALASSTRLVCSLPLEASNHP